jgi:hypothetical protein
VTPDHQPADRQRAVRQAPLWIRLLTMKGLRDRLSGQPPLVIAIAITGYLLSPFSAYNDALVNIPPSWFLAHLTARVLPVHEALLAGCYYVLSNILGIGMMGWAFSRVRPRPKLRWTLSPRQLLGSLVYVLITVVIVWVGFGGIAEGLRTMLGRG